MTDGAPPGHPPGNENFLGIYSSLGGELVAHYEIGGRIGEGAMGQVYKARDIRLNRSVAIKVLPQWARGDDRARARFLREAQAASALNHANIVTVYDIVNHKGVDLLVMEYIEGRILSALIPKRGLPVRRALPYAIQLVDAIAAAHAAGILHRDIKPANVMVTPQDRVKVLDFGIAEVLSSHRDSDNTAIQAGTRIYMSPEQLDGGGAGIRGEVYSVGLVLHQMLSGGHPFAGDNPDEIIDAIRRAAPMALPKKVPGRLADVVRRCLEREPERRFESVHAVLTNLAACAAPLARSLDRSRLTPGRQRASATPRSMGGLLSRINVNRLVESRQVLRELSAALDAGVTPETRSAVVLKLRDMLLTNPDDGHGVPTAIREVRRLALQVIRDAVDRNLAAHFQPDDFSHLDLVEMDFDGCNVSQLHFHRAFLIQASFRGARLREASFAAGWIRNVDFANADLMGVDFTDADWFNALHLTERQLQSVQRRTLSECPDSVPALHLRLAQRYAYPFESWSSRVQTELLSAWTAYLQPGGLRDIVMGWRRSS